MSDSLLKRTEIAVRGMLIRFMGGFVEKGKILPNNVDFNRCKYLFIRQDRIGDVLISTPLFEALKSHYPDIIIDVLLSKNNHFVLENDPLIRKRWVYKKRLGNIIALIYFLRRERYDFAIDLMDNPSTTSTIFCLLARARWNVGIEKENSFIYDITVPMLSRESTHIINRVARLLVPFGINPDAEDLTIRYYTMSESDIFANHFLQMNNLQNKRLIGINISAGGVSRFWGVDNFKRLFKHIDATYPEFKTLLLYQPSDALLAQIISKENPKPILSPADLTFDQYAALIKRLTFLITPDTSAVHLASAFKIGVVVLYVQSNKTLRIWEPYKTDYEVIVTNTNDLSMIPVEDVQDALRTLIERNRELVR